jgi:hypothetical protein
VRYLEFPDDRDPTVQGTGELLNELYKEFTDEEIVDERGDWVRERCCPDLEPGRAALLNWVAETRALSYYPDGPLTPRERAGELNACSDFMCVEHYWTVVGGKVVPAGGGPIPAEIRRDAVLAWTLRRADTIVQPVRRARARGRRRRSRASTTARSRSPGRQADDPDPPRLLTRPLRREAAA